jgi:hypothetical protein
MGWCLINAWIHFTLNISQADVLSTKILSRVTVTKDGFRIGNGFIEYLEVVTTNNYNTTADLHNLQSLNTNLLSLSALVLTDL